MIKNLPKGKTLVTSKFKTLQKITPILNNYQKIREKIIFLLTRPAQSQELIKITQNRILQTNVFHTDSNILHKILANVIQQYLEGTAQTSNFQKVRDHHTSRKGKNSKADVVAPTSNPSTWEVVARGSGAEDPVSKQTLRTSQIESLY